MHMSGGGVFRMVCSALLAASLISISVAGAQQPDTPKPNDAPPSAGGAPPPALDLKSTLGRAPKDVPLIDPCKSQHAPSYCNVKD
jgi:hypothetical protein